MQTFRKQRLIFPEKKYNKILKSKFKALNKITTNAMTGIQKGGVHYIADIYLTLMDAYMNLHSDVINFTPPKKGAGYIKSFRKSMIEVVTPLSSEVQKLRLEARDLLTKNEFLSDSGGKILSSSKKYVPFLSVPNGTLIMDKATR